MRTSPLRETLKRIPVLAPLYRAARRQWWRLWDAGRVRFLPKRSVAAVWDEATEAGTAGERARAWLSCDQVLVDYVYAQLGGVSWYGFIQRHCGAEPLKLGVSLCCGEGGVERNLIRSGVCRSCEGIDISPQALTYAREAARKAGFSTITYRVADVEKVKLEPERYDLAVGWMGLHHLTKLGRVLAQVKRGLGPNGLFIVNEYVGPTRFQMPKVQAELINTWLQKLPEELRRTPSGQIRDVFVPPTAADVIARDPSEAVSSDRILPQLRRHFHIVAQVDYGGVLLQWVLADLTQNFDPANAEHRAWLQRLYEAEREVLRSGTLPSDFTFIIARKPDRKTAYRGLYAPGSRGVPAQTDPAKVAGWLTCRQVMRGYVYPQFPGRDWYRFIRARYCRRPRRLALSLCCGDGAVERYMHKRRLLRACEGVDICPQAIAEARARAEAEGLPEFTYRVADVEKVELPDRAYDMVIGWMGLHHLSDLDRVFSQVSKALCPKGIFVVNEYVGPARFQMSARQAELINDWLVRLPAELRTTASGEVRGGFVPSTQEQVIACDPSEAISSERIVPELERHFAIAERIDYGGVLLHWILHGITHNFDPRNAEHRRWLQRLYEAEREVLRSGMLPSDFTFIIARKP